MNTELKTQKRVKYDGMPTEGNLPENIENALKLGVEKLNGFNLRGARAAIDQAIQANEIPESRMVETLDFMKRSSVKLQDIETVERELAKQVQPEPAPAKRSAFAIQNSIGDSAGTLARSFSLSRAIDTIAAGKQLTGAEMEAFDEARSEFRGARGNILVPSWMRTELRTVYGNDSGQSGIGSNVSGRQTLSAGDTRLALHNVPMAQQLGAQKIDATGSSTLLVPYLGRTDASTADEGAAASSASSFSELSLTPQRYVRKTSVSALSLSTTGQQLDSILLNDFDLAHSAAHDKVAFAAIRDNATFTLATASTNGLAATSVADLFSLATDTMTATGVSGYPDLLMSPIAAQVLNTSIVTNSDQTLGQLYVSQTGRRLIPVVSMADATFTELETTGTAGSDNIVGAGHVVAGLMSSCVIASWGGISLMVDPYSLRDNHVINVHADSYCAAGVVQDAFRILAVTASDIDATA